MLKNGRFQEVLDSDWVSFEEVDMDNKIPPSYYKFEDIMLPLKNELDKQKKSARDFFIKADRNRSYLMEPVEFLNTLS